VKSIIHEFEHEVCEEIKRLQNENIQLMQCVVDCINRPKGVVPDSVVNLNKGHFWNENRGV